MNNDLNMNEFREKKKKINDIKYITYNKIYTNLIETIKLTASNGINFCLFEIPLLIFGEPLYQINDIKNYLISKINEEIYKKNITEVIFYEPNILYINWTLD